MKSKAPAPSQRSRRGEPTHLPVSLGGVTRRSKDGDEPIRRPRRKRTGAGKRPAILVPIDFSESSFKALDCALLLARQLNGVVTALHVLNTSYGESFLDYDSRMKMRAESAKNASTKLGQLVKSRKDCRVPMEYVVRHGDVGYEIARFSEAKPVDLIVLGRKARNAMSRFVFGSVTSTVIDVAPCAVLVVPE